MVYGPNPRVHSVFQAHPSATSRGWPSELFGADSRQLQATGLPSLEITGTSKDVLFWVYVYRSRSIALPGSYLRCWSKINEGFNPTPCLDLLP